MALLCGALLTGCGASEEPTAEAVLSNLSAPDPRTAWPAETRAELLTLCDDSEVSDDGCVCIANELASRQPDAAVEQIAWRQGRPTPNMRAAAESCGYEGL